MNEGQKKMDSFDDMSQKKEQIMEAFGSLEDAIKMAEIMEFTVRMMPVNDKLELMLKLTGYIEAQHPGIKDSIMVIEGAVEAIRKAVVEDA